jgi:hypothetical protein
LGVYGIRVRWSKKWLRMVVRLATLALEQAN